MSSSAVRQEDVDPGAYWAAHDLHYDRMLARVTTRLFERSPIAPSDSVVDVGCGCGRTSLLAARRAASGRVLGVDLSRAMLAVARRRAGEAGLVNVDYACADAQTFAWPPIDVAISQFGVMFFDDPQTAFGGLAASMRSGGRLLFVCWKALEHNENRVVQREAFAPFVALPMPARDGPGALSFSDVDRVRGIIGRAGFEDVSFESVDEPLWFGADVDAAARFILDEPGHATMLAGLGEDEREQVDRRLRARLQAATRADGVWLGSAAWLVQARRS